MPILLVSGVRILRETLHAQLLASGLNHPIHHTNLDRTAWTSMPASPTVMFITCRALEGVPLVAEFRTVHPSSSVGVLALDGCDEEFLAWASAGISGYLEPDASADKIVGTISRLMAGEVVYPARLSALLLNYFGRQGVEPMVRAGVNGLTRRELEVIELLADGQANKQIARDLDITDATVKNHVHSILEKLNVRSRGEAAAYFHRLSGALEGGAGKRRVPALGRSDRAARSDCGF